VVIGWFLSFFSEKKKRAYFNLYVRRLPWSIQQGSLLFSIKKSSGWTLGILNMRQIRRFFRGLFKVEMFIKDEKVLYINFLEGVVLQYNPNEYGN